jgi:hypothetical protein
MGEERYSIYFPKRSYSPTQVGLSMLAALSFNSHSSFLCIAFGLRHYLQAHTDGVLGISGQFLVLNLDSMPGQPI